MNFGLAHRRLYTRLTHPGSCKQSQQNRSMPNGTTPTRPRSYLRPNLARSCCPSWGSPYWAYWEGGVQPTSNVCHTRMMGGTVQAWLEDTGIATGPLFPVDQSYEQAQTGCLSHIDAARVVKKLADRLVWTPASTGAFPACWPCLGSGNRRHIGAVDHERNGASFGSEGTAAYPRWSSVSGEQRGEVGVVDLGPTKPSAPELNVGDALLLRHPQQLLGIVALAAVGAHHPTVIRRDHSHASSLRCRRRI